MKIQEYLQAKYKTQKATTMLKLEAKVFGIEYPNRYGWWDRLAGLELTEQMKAKLIERLSAGHKTSRNAGLEALGVDVTQLPERAIVVPNPPGTSKKARAKAKKLERRLAHQVAIADGQQPAKQRVFSRAVVKKKQADEWARHLSKPKKTRARVLPVTTVLLTEIPHVPMPPPSGVDPRSTDFLMTYEWRRVRMMALKRYGAMCQCCGASPKDGAVMNVDHIKPRKFFPQLALDVDNLQILCNPCNEGKGNWDMTDWRHTEIESDPLHESNMAHMRTI